MLPVRLRDLDRTDVLLNMSLDRLCHTTLDYILYQELPLY